MAATPLDASYMRYACHGLEVFAVLHKTLRNAHPIVYRFNLLALTCFTSHLEQALPLREITTALFSGNN